jgi:hypothetical protein
MANENTTETVNKDVAAAADHVNNMDYRVSDKNFKTPEMGDFYIGAVDSTYLKRLDEIVNGKGEGEGDDKNAAFYTEAPPVKELGETPTSLFVKAHVNISQDDIDNGLCNGNTLNVSLDGIVGDSEGKAVSNIQASMFNNTFNTPMVGTESKNISVRLVGMKCPANPKWAQEKGVKKDSIKMKTVAIGDAAKSSDYVFANGIHDKSETITVAYIGNKWREITIYNQDDNVMDFRWCVDSGDSDGGSKDSGGVTAANNLKKLIDSANGEVYFLLDKNSCPTQFASTSSDILSDSSAIQQLASWNKTNDNSSNGLNQVTQDAAARFIGAAYVKRDGKWINLTKAALTDDSNQTLSADTSYDGKCRDVFKPARYDKDSVNYADAFMKLTDEIDDRKKIQHDIFNSTPEDLRKWTVTIGDVTLFVPPTSITCTSEIENERLPMLRSKGSMAKTGRRSVRHIQMHIYFNEERGINGFKYEAKTPNGSAIKYSINGLRSLVAQFKFVPYVPIDNEYINETLGISAVTVNNLSVKNVNGYPRLLDATLTVTEFDYTVYMPEATLTGIDNGGFVNFFAAAINWPTMRYYYQRALSYGDSFKENGLTYNSSDYNKAIIKNRTSLIPMSFTDPNVKFYVASADYLDKMLQAKLNAKRGKGDNNISFTPDEKNAAKDLGTIYDAIDACKNDGEFQNALAKLNSRDLAWSPKYSENGNYINLTGDTAFSGKEQYSQGMVSGTNLCMVASGYTGDREGVEKDLNGALSLLKAHMDEVNEKAGKTILSDPKFYIKCSGGNDERKFSAGVSYAVNLEYLSTDANYNDIRKDVSNYIDANSEDFFNDRRINVPLSLPLSNPSENYKTTVMPKNGELSIDMDNKDVAFLKYCQTLGKEAPDPNDTKRISFVNLNQLDNLYYEEYTMPETRVSNWSVALTNHISNLNVCEISGSSPQYLGGEDLAITMEVTTTSDEVVKKLSCLPQICAAYGRKYHSILPASVIKVQSEFAQFFGVNEVLVQNVQVDTTPNLPSVKTITIELISNDRSLRNREALNKIEADNAGKIGGNEQADRSIKSYFDIEKTIAQAELYPDLELPTIDEMQSAGWDYVRYKFQDDRKYVDPDFYFLYLNTLSSQIIRESIITSKDSGAGATTTWKDSTGANIKTEMSARKGFNVIARDAKAQKQKDKVIAIQNSTNKLNSKDLTENLRDSNLSNAEAADGTETWDICEDIKAVFLEKGYKQEYDSYQARVHAQQVSGTTGNAGAIDISGTDKTATQTAATSSTTAATNTTDTSSKAADTTSDSSDTEKTDDATKSDSSSGDIQTEGKWVATQLADAQKASKAIEEYLNGTGITETVTDNNVVKEAASKQSASNVLSTSVGKSDTPTTAGTSEASTSDKTTTTSTEKTCQDNSMESKISEAVNKFFQDASVQAILGFLNVEYTNETFLATVRDIVYAAACAATGEKEYSNKDQATGWRPSPDFIGVVTGNGQDDSNTTLAKTVDEAMDRAIEFGCFKIKQYDSSTFLKMTGESPKDVWGGSEDTNATHFLIDPYYRSKSIEEIKQYKKGCINNARFCTMAYLRIMLYWLKKLIDIQAFPAMTADVLRSAAKNEMSIIQKNKEKNVDGDMDKSMEQHLNFFSKRSYAVDAGKFWTACTLASGDGNTTIFDRIKKRDYRGLNGYISGCSKPASFIDPSDNGSLAVRKMTLALVGKKRIKDSDAIGVPQNTPATTYMRDLSEKKYIEAAEDPATYCMHACHDMIVNDARGRMLRAFPTYYMMFIDEGREIGMWKLHDNFYNNMCISSIQVVKSRKLPADTAIVCMSNFYQSFTTENEDYQKVEEETWGNTFKSIMSPFFSDDYGKEQEAKRKSAPPEDKIRLRPGARIHIRMGYGSNAAMLPVVFNGNIAEVTATDTVEFQAQGDGVELMNPIVDDTEGHQIINQDSLVKGWFTNGGTPKDIMNAILTSCGGIIKAAMKDLGRQDLLGRNPYGIYHFGNPDFTRIFKSGEPTQNIFEACAKPAWGDDNSVTSKYAMDEAPHITFDAFQKTIWDIANICKSVSPDYVCSVAPFDFRSTLFIGHPRYYYAYSYGNEGGAVTERRKPFQQFHFYSSASDIISNGIIASKSKMKTAALGLYQVAEALNIKRQEKVGPLFADIDIYPENQKTMIVDTQLYGKGIPIIGYFGGNLLADLFDYAADDKGSVVSHEKIAWRMTASALKDSVKDMYMGDLVVLGDPSIKPHDRVFIMDGYSGITGQCTVKEVVMDMSVDQGFVTTISPDCINTVDDRFENSVFSWVNSMGATGCAAIGGIAMAATCYLAGTVPTINKIKDIAKSTKIAKGAKKAADIAKDSKTIANAAKAAKTAAAAIKGVKAVGAVVGVAGAAVGGIAAATAAAPAIAMTLAACATTYAIGSFVNTFIERTTKNWQVLQIWPLKRYGLCWTAGVEGSKGLVVGSPSHDKQGALTKAFSYLANSNSKTFIGGLLTGLLLDEDVQKIADKYDTSQNVIDESGEPSTPEASYDNVLRSSAGQSGGNLPGDYRNMQIVPRADYNSGDDVQKSYDHFAVMDTEQYQNDPKIQYYRLVSGDTRLKPYIDEQFFKIIHETPALNKGEQVDSQIITTNGVNHYVKVIHYTMNNGKELCDMPLLHPDALNILYEIVRRAKNNMPAANASDKYEAYEDTKSSFIALESALRVGDTESQGAAGFTFILQAMENAVKPMTSAIKELHDEIAADAKDDPLKNAELFNSKDLGENKVAVVVRMPRVTSKNITDGGNV